MYHAPMLQRYAWVASRVRAQIVLNAFLCGLLYTYLTGNVTCCSDMVRCFSLEICPQLRFESCSSKHPGLPIHLFNLSSPIPSDPLGAGLSAGAGGSSRTTRFSVFWSSFFLSSCLLPSFLFTSFFFFDSCSFFPISLRGTRPPVSVPLLLTSSDLRMGLVGGLPNGSSRGFAAQSRSGEDTRALSMDSETCSLICAINWPRLSPSVALFCTAPAGLSHPMDRSFSA